MHGDESESGTAGQGVISNPPPRMPTRSAALDAILGGGLAASAVTDVFGAAATGKTQLAFQCALIFAQSKAITQPLPTVLFVDCEGSFRPERIVEMAESRGLSDQVAGIMDRISSVRPRSVEEQRRASDRLLVDERFSKCELMIVDDVTRNFVSEFGSREENLILRQFELARYIRTLNQIAIKRRIAILVTNTVRHRMGSGETETTGDIIAQFVLFRVRFSKDGRQRRAEVLQPFVSNPRASFDIEVRGIVP